MQTKPSRRSHRRALQAMLLAVVFAALAATPSIAASQWHVDVNTNSNAAPGGAINYHLQILNIGDAPADGTGSDPIVFTAALPSDVTATGVQFFVPGFGTFDYNQPPFFHWTCTGDGPGGAPSLVGAHNIRCSLAQSLAQHTFSFVMQPIIRTEVGSGASGTRESTFTVSGAGTSAVGTAEVTRITNAAPEFGIDMFDGEVTADAAGTPYTQAGGYPYAASTTIDFNSGNHPNPVIVDRWPVAAPKTLEVNLPPGLVGYPTAAPRCDGGQLADRTCPPAAQVGTTVVRLNSIVGSAVLGPVPVYNLDPPPDVPARFGFNVSGVITTLDAHVRSDSDYGITIKARNLPEGLAFTGTSVTLWGFPADPAHTPERACNGLSIPEYAPNYSAPCESGTARLPFLRNPTSCPEPDRGLLTTLRVDSWKDPGRFATASFVSHAPPGYPLAKERWGPDLGTTNCNDVPFDPTFRATPEQPARAGAPTAFTFDLSIPQELDPEGVSSQSDLKRAVVTLPQGVRLSPAAAAGLGACSPAQISLRTLNEPQCPNSSKVGDVTLTTPLLEDALTGAVYLGKPFDNPFGSLLSLYIVVRGHGVLIKLPGKVDANPNTGQLTATFDDNPQAPFSNLRLQFASGPRAPLVTPDQCGTYTTHAEMVGWSGATASSDSSFTLAQDADGSPCKRHGFSPSFNAGTRDPVAGKSSSFHLRITRPDQHELLSGVTVDMPQGLLGYISRTTLCAASDASRGACGDASKVGDVTVGSGAGSNPFYISNGRVYITGPHRGAPFGLSIVVPAVAGPFDLGTVNVRSALYVDKHDSTLRVVSDSLPTILEGIPLDVRDVRVDVNRPGFIVNPTSCAEKTIAGVIVSAAGSRAAVSSRFQLGDCAALGFKPKMVLKVGGAGHTTRNSSTPFSTRVTMPRGQANLRFVQVTLPKTINARLTVINDACTRREFEASLANCRFARAGVASAVTPLLDAPLRGNVYFVKNGHPLPDLFVALRGQVDFDLVGRITIPRSTFLRTTFATAPDVPIRSFSLRLAGDARNGSVGAAANLCSRASRRQKADVTFVGQNGKVSQVSRRLQVAGCDKKAAKNGKRGKK